MQVFYRVVKNVKLKISKNKPFFKVKNIKQRYCFLDLIFNIVIRNIKNTNKNQSHFHFVLKFFFYCR